MIIYKGFPLWFGARLTSKRAGNTLRARLAGSGASQAPGGQPDVEGSQHIETTNCTQKAASKDQATDCG